MSYFTLTIYNYYNSGGFKYIDCQRLLCRSTLYSTFLGPLPELWVLQIEEAYKNFDPLSKPLICSMSAEKLLVDSHFGKVQVGSLLSYQQPPITTQHIVHHKETSPFPSLPLDGYRLERNFQSCTFVFSEEDQLHIDYSGERIHRDPVVFSLIREKGDWYYLCTCKSS